jgi:3-hydroxyacyl-CoA dehydrogenase
LRPSVLAVGRELQRFWKGYRKMRDIKSVAVLGSGVMGSGIAGHFANAGIPVLLLDMPQKGLGKKNSLAKDAIERMLKADPAPLMHKRNADLITPGNFEDDLVKIKDVDWVIEVVIERLDIKQELYAQIEKVRGPHTIISSNTSTIPLTKLTEGRSTDFKKHFLITHFFNPPRYMRLLELVQGKETAEKVVETITECCDRVLGKGVVPCHDTPGFIGNRIGTYWLQIALLEAIDQKMAIEEVDALFGKPMGIPKTGVFALMDLVGLDLMPLIGRSMKDSLPANDPYVTSYAEPDIVKKMIADGYIGRKGKGGFYRMTKTDTGKKIKESLNLMTGEYAQSLKEVRLGCLDVSKEGLRRLLSFGDRGAQYAWSVLSKVLSYTASLVPEIADDIYAIDQAMQMGYNWKYGPFELLDKIGPAWFAARLKEEKRPVPEILEKVKDGTFYRVDVGERQYFTLQGTYVPVKRREGVLLLSDIKLRSKPLLKNASASLWDVGDGVCCLEFTSKQNSIDFDIMELIEKAIPMVQKGYKALVIYNEGSHFSVGANIGLALFAANVAAWDTIRELVKRGQDTYFALKYAPFPVVGAPSGMALGGGCEILLNSDAVQAHAESYIGLVEVGVGVIPAWGGCKETLGRWLAEAGRFGGSMVAVGKVFELIGTAQVAKSAEEAKEMKYLRKSDGITMNKDRLLFDAKAKALELAKDYKIPEPMTFSLPGATARVAMTLAVKGFVKAGKASAYDEEVAKRLAFVLSGGDTDSTEKMSETQVLELERNAFMMLIRNPKTLARIEYVLETGKPLRN